MPEERLVVATANNAYTLDAKKGTMRTSKGLDDKTPTCLAQDPHVPKRAWLGTKGGILRTDDAGHSWHTTGLEAEHVTALSASPTTQDLLWAGTEPSRVYRSPNAGNTWHQTTTLETLPSSSSWSFPPKPDTHHVRWITCHPHDPEHVYIAIEAGALVTTTDGGQTWHDRVPDGPYDTHQLTIHPDAPETLRVAAGDGYYESHDAGETWTTPREGLDVNYMVSVTTDPNDPNLILASGASHAHAAYRPGSSDGRLYRRTEDTWQRVTHGWPTPPRTIAPLLAQGNAPASLWAADERGIHQSQDRGETWNRIAAFPEQPRWLAALTVLS